jgi:putative glutamine amidotransferase
MRKVLVPLASIKLHPDTIAPIQFARETYIKKLLKYNLLPLFVSSLLSEEQIDQLYSMSDGVLFMGGQDFKAAHYHEIPHEKNDSPDENRDKVELYILKKVLQDKKPFLGICRGCQALAIASGGKLYQHLPEKVEGEVHTLDTYDKLKDIHHTVTVNKNSIVFEILKKVTLNVNSAHHQAVESVGKDLEIVGSSPRGVTEIIEHKDKSYFCIGIQSHPEALEYGDLEPLFKAFAETL